MVFFVLKHLTFYNFIGQLKFSMEDKFFKNWTGPFLTLVSFLCVSLVEAQHKYYFKIGSKDGLGIKTKPFFSLQQLRSVSLQPGDTVFLLGCDRFDGNI